MMKYLLKMLSLILILLLISCGGKEEKKEKEAIKLGSNATETKKVSEQKVSTDMIDMSNKGIGPITSVTLSETIDQALAATGAEVFKAKCTACHKPTKKFIGPAPLGVLERRSPEWIMNMILNPEEMTQKDPIARQLLIANNGSPMANQSLTQEEARAILEYFRTIKAE
jgi:mono/diheme cytochrome c family protein